MTTLALRDMTAALPEAARMATEIVVDNPVSCALLASTVILAPRVALRLVRPRTPLEALALAVVLQFGLTYGLGKAVTSGLLPIRVRDHHGCLHRIGEIPDADCPDPAA